MNTTTLQEQWIIICSLFIQPLKGLNTEHHNFKCTKSFELKYPIPLATIPSFRHDITKVKFIMNNSETLYVCSKESYGYCFEIIILFLRVGSDICITYRVIDVRVNCGTRTNKLQTKYYNNIISQDVKSMFVSFFFFFLPVTCSKQINMMY